MSRVKLPYRLPEPLRADLVLKGAALGAGFDLSRRKLKSLFESGKVHLNDRLVSASDPVTILEGAIEVDAEAWSALNAEPELMPAPAPFIPKIWDEGDLFALDKPSGMPSVPHSAEERLTAVNHALAYHPELSQAFPRGFEPGLLHRLDNDTSGALLFAKTPETFQELRTNWKTDAVKKTYRAVVVPEIAQDSNVLSSFVGRAPFLIDTAIGRDAKSDRRMKTIEKDEDLKRIRGNPLPARTRVVAAQEIGKSRIDVTVEIETGVMHQIRAHLASIGFPILGDSVYGSAVAETEGEAPDSRLWLHAWRIDIRRDSGRRMTSIEAPLPDQWPSNDKGLD